MKYDQPLREYYFLFALACQAACLFQASGGALTLATGQVCDVRLILGDIKLPMLCGHHSSVGAPGVAHLPRVEQKVQSKWKWIFDI